MPHYELNDFIVDCSDPNKRINIRYDAQNDAKRDFNLKTDKAIREFIANGGLENPRHIVSEPWRYNPKKNHELIVDSYSFYSGHKYGYIAIIYNDLTNFWIVKSFKKNNNSDPRNKPLGENQILIDLKNQMEKNKGQNNE